MRKTRYAIALLLLLFFAAAFADLGSEPLRKALLAIQLTPTAARMGWGLAIVALFLTVTMLFGRWYCSLLCPAGLVQEVFHRLGRMLGISRLGYRKTGSKYRGWILLLTVSLVTILVDTFYANFVDPVGLFGRFALFVKTLLQGDAGGNILFLFVALLGAVVLVLIPLFKGRWFCDRLCPVGALLGMVATNSRQAIRLDAAKCVACGRCAKICQTGCINIEKKSLDDARCILCLDCLGACQVDAIAYTTAPNGSGRSERRNFMQGVIAASVGGLFVFSRKIGQWLDPSPEMALARVMPPGATDQFRHQARCVACQSCVVACPVGIVQPVRNLAMRPYLDYDRGFCQYNCKACTDSCPAGAFDPLSLEEKQKTRIGRTTLHLDRCVVVTNNTACGACAEVCPTHAVIMVEQEGEGKPTIPDFKAEYCIGCGACYHVCPSAPRAFVVEGLAKQELAAGIRIEGHGAGAEPARTRDDADELVDFPF